MKEQFEEIKGYCQETGKSFTLLDLIKEKGCYKTKKYFHCKCHKLKLVELYPFKIKSS